MAFRVNKMVQIRDVPDDVHAELRRRAAAAGLSLSDFARQELSRSRGAHHWPTCSIERLPGQGPDNPR